jgi:cyclic pyranopterin phosphate synthase
MPKPKRRSHAKSLSHVDRSGNARMVNIGDKPVSRRVAVAEGFVTLARATVHAIAKADVPKGDVFACARVAAIQAAKRCEELIPLCHSLPLDAVDVSFAIPRSKPSTTTAAAVQIHIRATVSVTARTGVEMEALTAVAVAALTVYDMCKAIDKSIRIDGIRLVSKTKKPLT